MMKITDTPIIECLLIIGFLILPMGLFVSQFWAGPDDIEKKQSQLL